jgi:hypothetical protein
MDFLGLHLCMFVCLHCMVSPAAASDHASHTHTHTHTHVRRLVTHSNPPRHTYLYISIINFTCASPEVTNSAGSSRVPSGRYSYFGVVVIVIVMDMGKGEKRVVVCFVKDRIRSDDEKRSSKRAPRSIKTPRALSPPLPPTHTHKTKTHIKIKSSPALHSAPVSSTPPWAAPREGRTAGRARPCVCDWCVWFGGWEGG